MRVKGGTKMTCVCFAAILLGTSVGQVTAERPGNDSGPLVSSYQALVGVTGVRIVLALPGAGLEIRPVDVTRLRAAVVERLRGAGIRPVEDETGLVPRLLVRMECTPVPDSDNQVCRVQVSLIRLVTLPERPDFQIQAEVWQGGPAVQIVAKEEAAGAIRAGVLNQVQVFVEASRIARTTPAPGLARAVPPAAGRVPSNPADPRAVGWPFVCSKNSEVFHCSGCRLARDIAAGNLIGYKSREEAVRAGKRPCKVCKP
jgi:hypothetical protein